MEFIPKNLFKKGNESHLNTHPELYKKNYNGCVFFSAHFTVKHFAGRYIDPRRRAPSVYVSGRNF